MYTVRCIQQLFWLYRPETAEFKNKFMNYGSKWGKKRWCKHTLLGIFQWILAGSKGHNSNSIHVCRVNSADWSPTSSYLRMNITAIFYSIQKFTDKIEKRWLSLRRYCCLSTFFLDIDKIKPKSWQMQISTLFWKIDKIENAFLRFIHLFKKDYRQQLAF